MKKIFILKILTLFSLTLNATDSLKIFFNSSYCASCNSIGNELKSITHIPKTIYLLRRDSFIVDELFERYAIEKVNLNTKFISNDFYPQKNRFTFQSFCVYVKSNNKKDSFLLKDLGNNLWKLNTINKITTIPFPNNLKFSNNARITYVDKYFSIADYSLNKNISFKINNNLIENILEIKTKDLNIEDFLNCNCVDKKLFKFMEQDLLARGRGRPQILKSFVSNNNINILYNIGSPIPKGLDTSVGFKMFVYSKNILNNKTELHCIKSDGLDKDGLINKSFFIYDEYFILKNDTVFLPAVTENSKQKTLLIKYILKNNNYELIGPTKNLGNELPKEFDFNYQNKNFIVRKVNNSFYYMLKYPLLYNYIKNETIYMYNAELIKKLSNSDATICDVKQEDNLLYILFYENKKLSILKFNKINNKLIDTILIDYNKNIREPMFYDETSICNFTEFGIDLIAY